MAKRPTSSNPVDQVIDETIADELQGVQPATDVGPTYRVIGESRIPVSKATGKLWKARRDQAKAYIEGLQIDKAWEECIAYYKNDQSASTNKERDPSRETATTARGFSRIHSETENFVFANVSALVPATYAKNPTVEVTSEDKAELEPFARTCEKLINALFRLKIAPGVNLKPKARRGVVMSTLTNICFFEVGWVFREDSSERAMEDLAELSTQLEKAKDTKEVKEIEGKIMALEHTVNFLNPAGPYVRFRDMRDVLLDPNATMSDASDANWVFIRDFMPTEFLRARYGEKDENGEFKSIYKSTHVLKAGDGRDLIDDDLTNSIFRPKKSSNFRDYGYSDEESFKDAQRTAVWYCWDRITRRVYLYLDEDWSWPLWVWDDPYQLNDFYNIVPLSFYTDPETMYARSEVMYYLDQQDEINRLNSEIKRIREFMLGKIIYNKNLVGDEDVEKFLSNITEKRALGVKLPADADISKLFFGVELPALNKPQILDKGPLIESINRLSSVGVTMRNEQFKTNTTNQAIEKYDSSSQTRLDEKIDAIEDCVGEIGWKVLQLCVRNMPPEMVADLIGDEHAEVWNQFASPDNLRYINLSVVGGSALKPTSKAKKEEAVQVAQALGQFANASPAAVIVMLKLFERAFDDFVISASDWQMISESITSQMNKGRTDGAGGGGEGAPTTEGANGSGDPTIEQVISTLDQIIGQLPPALRKKLGDSIASGATPSEAIQAITQGTQ